MSEKISCEICGEEVHVINSHLKKEHGPSSVQPMTYEEYKDKFPNAPVLSETAKDLQKAKMKNKSITKARSTGKIALHDAFSLPVSALTNTGDGKPIMIDFIESQENPELVPDTDDNYVFDVETVKTAMMGIYANIPIYFYGYAGVGKSSFFKQLAARTNRAMVRVQHTVNTEESHIVGQWVVKKHKDEDTGQIISVTEFELGPLALAMKNGWMYLADEYDRAYPSVLSVYQAVLEGEPLYIQEADEGSRLIRPHKDFRFVATGNTNGAGDDTGLYPATVQQDAATFERFGITYQVPFMERDREIEVVSKQADLLKEDSEMIVEFCEKIREKFPSEVSLTISPRVSIRIAEVGLMKGNYARGVELCFANRLPDSERQAVMEVAQRYWG